MKRMMSILLALLVAFLPAMGVSAVTPADLVGKYLTIGTCNGVPVTYRIWGTRDVDSDGTAELFLASEELLFQKAYNTTSSGNWAASSLRTYLNDTQSGFLAGFSAAERALIAPVTQKTLLGQAGGAAGGNCFFLNTNSSISNWCVGNATAFNAAWATAEATDYKYDNAYYTMSTDTVFIPSLKDAYDYGIIPGVYSGVNAAVAGTATPTSSAYYYWFRDTQAASNMWRFDVSDGKVKTIPAPTYANLWVRPAFYLEPSFDVRGAGTKSDPYRISTGFDPAYTVKQGGTPVGDTLAQGTTAIGGSVWLGLESGTYTLKASAIKVADGKETMVDYAEQVLTLGDNTINLSLQSSGADCYISLSACDASGTPVAKAHVVGAAPAVTAATRTVTALDVAAQVADHTITVKGDVPAESGDMVTVRIAKRDNASVIAYSNQVAVPASRSFDLAVNVENLFGGVASADGWYTVELIAKGGSDSADAGIAGDGLYDTVIAMFNGGEWTKVTDVFTKDEAYMLEYSAVSGKGFYEQEYADNEQVLTNALAMMAENKPDGGWTTENIVDEFNRYVSFAYFDAADTAGKYAACENERYAAYLGTTELVSTDYYKKLSQLKDSAAFADITSANIDEMLSKNIVLATVRVAENSTEVRTVIEAEAENIGIDFASGYANLSASQYKTLYDELLGVAFEDVTALADAFDIAYDKAKIVKKKKPSSSGGGGGGGSVSIVSTVPTQPVVVVPPVSETVPVQPVSGLSDIADLTWGKEAVEALYEMKIVSGDQNAMFRPDDFITREEMAKIFAVAFGVISDNEVTFDDVSADDWYYEYVSVLAGAGIINGVGESTFGVGQNLTREDLAVMLYRVMGLVASQTTAEISDLEQISNYAADAVNTLCAMGIINGYEDGTFRPAMNVTRREAAVLIYRAMGGEK
ncbi:MAG: S-layer homology domain-containing protein [Ruminococcaceae bacterium]|nr:S-layer homology domain-containing protein [Oscillospiraceae bacterium]